AFGAVDLDPCFILAAMRDLRGGDGAERAIAVAKDGGTVIVERPARLERFQMTGNLFGNQPGDEATEIIGMSADVAEAAGRAGLLGIGAPSRLLLPGCFKACAQPALNVEGAHGVR